MTLPKISILAATALFASVGAVGASPLVSLVTHGYVVHASVAGPKLQEFSSQVVPRSGDLIEWKVVARNDGRDPAKRLVTNLPIPPSTEYVVGSATGSVGVAVSFSIDGGKTFASKPMRVVHTAQGDVSKPVEPSAYTTVRWIDQADLAVNSSASFSYEAKVK